MEQLSSTSQWSSSASIMLRLRELTPLVSRRYCGIAPPLMNSCWCDTSHRFLPIHRFWVVVNREHWIPFARHPFSRCRRYSMTSSETSRPNVSWSSSPLDFLSVYWIHDEKYHSCPSKICIIIRKHLLTSCRPIQTWSCISCSSFPWERYTLILVYHHLFPSICLFSLYCDITYLSSENCLLM